MPFNVKELAKMRAIFGGGGAKEEEAVTAALNFANGNQTVLPSEGKVLSSVTIEKPATLLPENIADGVDIAGIIGTLAAGGGGGDIKFYHMDCNPTSDGCFEDSFVITHNMGVVPDIAIIFAYDPSAIAKAKAIVGTSFSKAFNDLATASGSAPYGVRCYNAYKDASSGLPKADVSKHWMDDAKTSWTYAFYHANAETVSVGRCFAGQGLDTSQTYYIYLIGGLT